MEFCTTIFFFLNYFCLPSIPQEARKRRFVRCGLVSTGYFPLQYFGGSRVLTFVHFPHIRGSICGSKAWCVQWLLMNCPGPLTVRRPQIPILHCLQKVFNI
ncbi:hypothetical protein FKM82_003008 [Ascaphus truei]